MCDLSINSLEDAQESIATDFALGMHNAPNVIVDLNGATLTAAEKRQLQSLLNEYRDVFANDKTELESITISICRL